MDQASRVALMILATAAVIAGLYAFRAPLTQVALAMLLFFGIDGSARFIRRRTRAPRWLAYALALIAVPTLIAAASLVVAQNVGRFIERAPNYERRLNELLALAHDRLGIAGPPLTIAEAASRFSVDSLAAEFLGGLQGLMADAMFVGVFLAFIFAASASFPKKLDAIFTTPTGRRQSRRVMSAIRTSMERYLWVQTIISLGISILSFFTLWALGLDNPLFWSLVIFFLNYIPTIGSIVATIGPTLVALVQFDSLGPVIGVAAGLGIWQFGVGNFIQPRLMGDSLNLSALVVLLSLALWGLVWGIAGAFLAAPLTVMLMIVLAQFPGSRWIAILLSADANPARRARAAPVNGLDTEN